MHTAPTTRQQAEARWERAMECFARSQRISYVAWQHIAASKGRITRSPRISGASETDDDTRRQSIRARLSSGALPVLDGSAWAGLANGDHRCACCHETIRAREIEYEPRDQGPLHAHVHCFTIWLAESRLALPGARRPPATHPDGPPPPARPMV